MATLNLNNPNYAAEVLSYYLWGEATPPAPEAMASKKWIERQNGVTLSVDPDEFVQKYGHLFNAKDFKLAEVFFTGRDKKGKPLDISILPNVTRNEDGNYELTHKQLR